MSCHAGCCNSLTILTIYHSEAHGLCSSHQPGWVADAGQQNALFHAVIQEPELLLSGALLVSRLWRPPLALLHPASGFSASGCAQKKGGWVCGGVKARPVGSLSYFH